MSIPSALASAIFAALLVLSGASAAADSTVVRNLRTAHDVGLQRGLERVVHDAGLTAEVDAGRLALALVDVTDVRAPRLAMLNGDEMMYAASLPKVAILLGAFSEAESGRLVLDERRL